MSGVYIKGMEMPVERQSFQITIKYNGLVFDTETGIQIAEAQEVPDHGRLIDADALAEEHRVRAYRGMTDNSYSFHTNARAWVNDAPTIIPADKEAGE